MIRRIVSLCLVLLFAALLHAQDESRLKYKGFVDIESGMAYNLNTAQTVSTNNMQYFSSVTTTHGVQLKPCFVGIGVGYYHSFRDDENIYPIFGAFRYDWKNVKLKPFTDLRLGIVYDPYWISKVQAYGAIGLGVELYRKVQLGCMASIFSRPSRYFTANVALVLGYAF